MKKQLPFFIAIAITIIVSSCENNREPAQVLLSKYYFTDSEVTNILSRCTKCHDGVAPYGKKVNAADYAKVKAVWAASTTDYKGSLMYKAVVKPSGTMVGPEFGGISDFESQVLIKWLETGAQQSK